MSGNREISLYERVFTNSARAAALVEENGRIHLSNNSFRKTIKGSRLPHAILDTLKRRRAFQVAEEKAHARFLITDAATGREQPATLTRLPGNPREAGLYLLEYHGHFEETRLETALQESEQRFFTLQQNLPVGIYRANQDGDLETVNNALLRMTGYGSFADLQLAELEDVWADVRERDVLIQRLRREGAVLGYIVHLKRKNGSEFIASFDARGNFDSRGNLVYFDTIVQDITEQVKAREELERLATSDSLTGLANRQHLMSRLEAELKRAARYGKPVTLLMIDLDHFKRINDSRGHQAGDAVLREFAGLIRETLRETDFAGRYGGEEFCVVLPETNLAGGITMAERIREATGEHDFLVPGGERLRVTCSIGVAAAESPVVEELVAAADARLYQAKAAGRNRIKSTSMESPEK